MPRLLADQAMDATPHTADVPAPEGSPKNWDVTRWGQFTDIKDIKKEMLKRLETHFEKWLNL
jgi:hypothetical protein